MIYIGEVVIIAQFYRETNIFSYLLRFYYFMHFLTLAVILQGITVNLRNPKFIWSSHPRTQTIPTHDLTKSIFDPPGLCIKSLNWAVSVGSSWIKKIISQSERIFKSPQFWPQIKRVLMEILINSRFSVFYNQQTW